MDPKVRKTAVNVVLAVASLGVLGYAGYNIAIFTRGYLEERRAAREAAPIPFSGGAGQEPSGPATRAAEGTRSAASPATRGRGPRSEPGPTTAPPITAPSAPGASATEPF